MITAPEALVRVPAAVLSHESAAVVLGIELVEEPATQRLTVPRSCSGVRLDGWSVRRAPLPAPDVLHRDDGLRLTSPARTVADLCAVLPLAQAVAAADSALRKTLLTGAALDRRLRAGRGPGCPERRSVAGLVDQRAGSVLESLLRILLHEHGILAPSTQHPITADGRVVQRVDFCWPVQRLVVEADGFAFHSDRDAYRRDRRRMNQLESLGWRVLRFSWEDVVDRPSYVVALVGEGLRQAA